MCHERLHTISQCLGLKRSSRLQQSCRKVHTTFQCSHFHLQTCKPRPHGGSTMNQISIRAHRLRKKVQSVKTGGKEETYPPFLTMDPLLSLAAVKWGEKPACLFGSMSSFPLHHVRRTTFRCGILHNPTSTRRFGASPLPAALAYIPPIHHPTSYTVVTLAAAF